MAKNRALQARFTISVIAVAAVAFLGTPAGASGEIHERILMAARHVLTDTGVYVALLIGFAILVAAPFYPALRELFWSRDRQPQTVDMSYTKEPRFMERSFLKKIHLALGDTPAPGRHTVTLSQEETVDVRAGGMTAGRGTNFSTVMVINGDLTTLPDVSFDKELVVRGSAVLGEETLVRGVTAHGDLTMGRRSAVIRWLGADGNVTIGPSCNLGVRAVSDKELRIGEGSKFHFLAGSPIVAQGASAAEPAAADRMPGDIRNHAWYVDRRHLSIPPGVSVDKDIVVKGSVYVGAGSRLTGSITATGTVALEEHVAVAGSIFADEGIAVGDGCTVGGNVFSLHDVRLGRNVRIGVAGGMKSVIGKDRVSLRAGTTVYGTILTEREGSILP